MRKWHRRAGHLVAATAVVMSALLIPGGSVPTADAAPSGFHDGAWTGFFQSVVSKYLDPGSALQYGVYSVAAEWQGKSTTPLTAPSVGDVFYVHIYTEVYNTWQATYRMRVLMPAGLQLVSPTAANDVYCEISNFSNVETRLMGECAAPYMFGGYATFPAVSSGINERLHFWFPVTATQPMSGTAANMQVLSDQTNAPAVSLPNPTLLVTQLLVVSPSATTPAAPTGLTAAAGNASATISFTPGSSGASAITNYQYSLNSGAWTALSPADAASPVTITGLTNGATYSVQLRAVNSSGAGTASPSVTVTPTPPPPPPPNPPLAPTGLSAAAGNGSATISFTQSSNGSAIANYYYSLNAGAWTALSPADAASPVTITGLTNGTTYNVQLRAVSSVLGAVSSSVTVTPLLLLPPIIFPPIVLPPVIYVPPPYVPPPPTPTPTPTPAALPPANVPPIVTVNPVRVYDSRSALGGRLAGSVTEIAVTGRAGVPSDAEGVVLNVTAVNASAPGYMTVFPCGAAPPDASNLNYAADQTIPNSVVAKVGAGGKVCVFTSAQADLLVDVNGYLPAGSDVNPLDPARLYDSRRGDGPRPDGSVTVVQVAGMGGVPADATTAVLNVTALNASAPGYMTVFPCGTAPPDASNLNFPVGVTIANAVVAKLDAAGKVCVFTYGSAGLLVDVGGYIAGALGYSGMTPRRLYDSRPSGEVRAAGTVTEIDVYGTGAVPAGAPTVVLNATAVGALAAGYMTVFPCGSNPPDASNLNFSAGQTIPNAVIAKVGVGGKVCVFTSAPAHLLVDVGGYTTA